MEQSEPTYHKKLIDHLTCEMGNAIEVYRRTADSIGIKLLSRKRETMAILAESVGYECSLVETETKTTDTAEWEYAKMICVKSEATINQYE